MFAHPEDILLWLSIEDLCRLLPFEKFPEPFLSTRASAIIGGLWDDEPGGIVQSDTPLPFYILRPLPPPHPLALFVT